MFEQPTISWSHWPVGWLIDCGIPTPATICGAATSFDSNKRSTERSRISLRWDLWSHKLKFHVTMSAKCRHHPDVCAVTWGKMAEKLFHWQQICPLSLTCNPRAHKTYLYSNRECRFSHLDLPDIAWRADAGTISRTMHELYRWK